MAWLRGKVALGSFPDLAEAVNKISESAKNIEKNFDNALGLEDQHGGSTSTVDGGNLNAEFTKKASKESASSEKHDDSLKKHESSSHIKEGADADESVNSSEEKSSEGNLNHEEHQDHPVGTHFGIQEELYSSAEKALDKNAGIPDQTVDIVGLPAEAENIVGEPVQTNMAKSYETTVIVDNLIKVEADSQIKPIADNAEESEHGENSRIGSTMFFVSKEDELVNFVDQVATTSSEIASYEQDAIEPEPHGLKSHVPEVHESVKEDRLHLLPSADEVSKMVSDVVSKDESENAKVHIVNRFAGDEQRDEKEHNTSSGRNLSINADFRVELETLKMELKKMEATLLGAARQAQAKADEIAKLMNENEQLKSIAIDQKRKSNAHIETLQEEYHQRVSALERKL